MSRINWAPGADAGSIFAPNRPLLVWCAETLRISAEIRDVLAYGARMK